MLSYLFRDFMNTHKIGIMKYNFMFIWIKNVYFAHTHTHTTGTMCQVLSIYAETN